MARSFHKLLAPVNFVRSRIFFFFNIFHDGNKSPTPNLSAIQSMDMDPCRPKNRDACKDPELKADPDIAGIGVSYHFSAKLS